MIESFSQQFRSNNKLIISGSKFCLLKFVMSQISPNNLLAYCLIYQKCLKRFYTNKSIVLWKANFRLTYAALKKITMRSARFRK